MRDKMDNFKYSVSEALELPKDIVMDLPKITLIGNIQVNILNHKGIIEYTDNTLRINSSIGVIKINGSQLKLKTILLDEIIVTGTIEDLQIMV